MKSVQLTAYYVSSIVGVGILTTPVIAFQMAGSYSVWAWLLLMLASVPFAGLFAYVAIKKPHPSGVGEFIAHVFGHTVSKAIVLLMIVTYTIGNPVMGITSARYLGDVMTIAPHDILLYGYGFMILAIFFNLFGVEVGAKIQSWLLAILLIGLLTLIGLSLPHVNWQQLDISQPLNHIDPIGQAMVIGFFSFLGWENVCSLADDVETPQRTFTISVIVSIIIIGLLYLGIAISYTGLVTEGNGNDTLISVLLTATIGDSKMFASILALGLLIVATNAWVLGASKLLTSLNISVVRGRRSFLFLMVAYAITLSVLDYNNGLENILIEIAGANFFIVYIVSFLAIIFSVRGHFAKNTVLVGSSIVSIIIVSAMMSFIALKFVVLAIVIFLTALVMVWIKDSKDSVDIVI